jgi:hypothetical protein
MYVTCDWALPSPSVGFFSGLDGTFASSAGTRLSPKFGESQQIVFSLAFVFCMSSRL